MFHIRFCPRLKRIPTLLDRPLILMLSKSKVDSGEKPVRAIELAGNPADGYLPAVLVLERPLDIGSNQDLESRTETVSRVVARKAIKRVGRRVHHVIARETDDPGVEPVLRFDESPAEGDGRIMEHHAGRHARWAQFDEVVDVVAIHAQTPHFELVV